MSDRLINIHLNKTFWLVREDYQDELLAACRCSWGRGEVLRVTPNRRVLRVQGKRPLLVKHFRHSWPLGTMKALFAGVPAVREWKALLEAQRRGFRTATPVALGERGKIVKRESILVTEVLDGAVALDRYLAGPERAAGPKRWKAVEKVATLIRQSHDLGFYQRDLHLGNILIREGKDGFEAFLIDLQRVDLLSSLTPEMRWRNLGVLHGGWVEASLTDRLRFLKAYLSVSPPIAIDTRALVARLNREGWKHRFQLWRTREKRCLAENREFVQVQAGLFFGVVRRDWWHENFQNLLRAPERLLTEPEVRVVKNSRTTTVGVIPFPEQTLYVKRYNYQNLAYALKHVFRPSRARRAWVAANSLRMRGLPVPLPVAYLERRRFRVLLESYVINEAIQGEMITDIFGRYLLPFLEKRSLIRELALLLRRMHESGVTHRDLKGPNIVARREETGRYHLCLVDLDGVRLGPVSWQQRVKNLARLAREVRSHPSITRSDRLRFLKTYLGSQKEEEWKKLWCQIRGGCLPVLLAKVGQLCYSLS